MFTATNALIFEKGYAWLETNNDRDGAWSPACGRVSSQPAEPHAIQNSIASGTNKLSGASLIEETG